MSLLPTQANFLDLYVWRNHDSVTEKIWVEHINGTKTISLEKDSTNLQKYWVWKKSGKSFIIDSSVVDTALFPLCLW